MSQIVPLYPHPALSVSSGNKKYIVLSDLHIGFDYAFHAKGIQIDPTYDSDRMIEEVTSLITEHQAEAIVLLGDTKHTIGFINKYEWRAIPEFLSTISKYTEVYFVPGNHDGNLGRIIPDNINLISTKGMVLEDTLLIHGHTMPSRRQSFIKRIIMGHLHPTFYNKDSIINGQRVWLYFKVDKTSIFPNEKGTVEIIVVPSFSTHFDLKENQRQRGTHLISPIAKRILDDNSVLDSIVVTLDGYVIACNR
ncbi:MAG TPA: metallophosphoesterase [Nitrososphaeraceae archaeon]|nr:metallophosphoesterase [Nitrososphaeraceae archaeon]